MNGLRERLKGIPDAPRETNPRSTASPFDDIATEIARCWKNDGAIVPFLMSVFSLPVNIARALGFENVVMIVDIELEPHEPFTATDDYVFAVEVIKYTLDRCNFVVACKNTQHFLHAMEPMDETGIDLLAGIEMMPTMDVV